MHLLQIARRLLGKILIDLRNTREEAICVAGLKSKQDQHLKPSEKQKDDGEDHGKHRVAYEEFKRCGNNGDKSIDPDDEDDRETKYRLDPEYL